MFFLVCSLKRGENYKFSEKVNTENILFSIFQLYRKICAFLFSIFHLLLPKHSLVFQGCLRTFNILNSLGSYKLYATFLSFGYLLYNWGLFLNSSVSVFIVFSWRITGISIYRFIHHLFVLYFNTCSLYSKSVQNLLQGFWERGKELWKNWGMTKGNIFIMP